MKMMSKYGSYINNKWAYEGKIYPCINPANGQTFANIYAGTAETVNEAVAAAGAAFFSFSHTSRVSRAKILRNMADRLEENIDLIAMAECLDTGKTFGEAKLQQTFNLNTYRYFAAAIESKEEIAIAQDNGTISYVVREPLGVAALIVAWNCPPMLLAWKLAPALAMGNTVVIKPSISAVSSISETLRIWQDILPQGVVNMVLGSSGDIGDALVNHPDIAKISFTGSVAAGRNIGAAAGQHIIPVTLELGGKSASICFEDADIERYVEKSCIGILSSAGEVCVGNSRLIIQDTVYDQVLKLLKEKFEKAILGNPMDPRTQIGPLTEEKHMKKVLAYIESGKAEGATLITGGYRYTENGCAGGYFVKPTIFTDVTPNMKIAQEEIFGPVVCVMKFHDENEALTLANGTDYGLAGAVWTKNIYRAIRFGQEMEAGIVWINDYLDTGVSQPFGGIKKSGIGREVNKMALENYSRVKNICFATDQSVPSTF